MIDRAFILVSGPAGSGKTTLIERILASDRSHRVAGVRFTAGPPASARPELERYAAAGAWATESFACPHGSEPDSARDFEESEFRMDAHEAFLMEGPADLDVPADLRVFVLAPPSGKQTLLVLKDRTVKITALTIARSLFGESALAGRVAREFKAKLPNEVHRVRMHELRRPYRDIVRADVVVVNARGARQRPAAERAVAELRRIQTDPVVARDLGPIAVATFYRSKILVADLADPRDRELKKLVAKVKRLLPRPDGDADE